MLSLKENKTVLKRIQLAFPLMLTLMAKGFPHNIFKLCRQLVVSDVYLCKSVHAQSVERLELIGRSNSILNSRMVEPARQAAPGGHGKA